MNLILGEILPPAIGVAISPLPVMIVLLLLVARNVRSAVGYVAGWALGILCVGVLLIYIADGSLRSGDEEQSLAIAVGKILLGVIFLLMAGISLGRTRPVRTRDAEAFMPPKMEERETGGMQGDGFGAQIFPADTVRQMSIATAAPLPIDDGKPGWMRGINRISPWLAFGIAAFSAFNPKNLSMITIAVTDINAAGFTPVRGSLAFLNFAALSTISVAAPLFYWIYKRDAADVVLQRAERWLSANQGYIMAGLFLVLGVMSIYKGWTSLPD